MCSTTLGPAGQPLLGRVVADEKENTQVRTIARRRPASAAARTPRSAPSPGRIYLAMCAVLIMAAVLMVGRYFQQSPPPPAPPGALGAVPAAMTARTDAVPGQTTPALRDPQGTPPPVYLKPSPPVRVHSSTVGINSTVTEVGLNEDDTIEVPTSYDKAAWYRLGPTPGERGAAVIIGHVDSYQGPGVFFNVGDMRPGQLIDVTRADHSVVHFRVNAINTYPKDLFPTEAVYGPINYAGLRLITCGGAFDEKTRNYANNVVVFASLTDS